MSKGLSEHDLFEYYLRLYFYELEHREAMNARLTHSTTVIALLAGALIFLLGHPVSETYVDLHSVWVMLIWAGTIALIAGVVATALAWWGFRYRFASDPNATERWRADAMKTDGFDEASFRTILLKNVLTHVAEVTSYNRVKNKAKSRWAAAGRLSILVAAACYGGALIPWALSPNTQAGQLPGQPEVEAPGEN